MHLVIFDTLIAMPCVLLTIVETLSRPLSVSHELQIIGVETTFIFNLLRFVNQVLCLLISGQVP